MFLTVDKIGLSSGTVYGVKGERVRVLGVALGEMVLVETDVQRFYVYPNELSENPINEKTKETCPSSKTIKEGGGRGKSKSKGT